MDGCPMVPPGPNGGPGSVRPRWCATRALKNARSLEQMLPREFPPLDPGESPFDRVPFEALLHLHLRSPAELDAVDGRLARLARPVPGPGALRGPLFQGTLRFLAVTFDVGGGRTVSLERPDLATAIQFATVAAPVLERYAAQYGPCRLDVLGAPVAARWAVADGRFTDAQLRAWLASLRRAGTIQPAECPVVLAPPGVVNADAPVDLGVLGYHGRADGPYVFVNVLGTGLTVDDPQDRFALALSHEIAEMTVDPAADGANPEVCDPCGPNCQSALRDYFAADGRYLGTTAAFPPAYSYRFFLNAVVQPAAASACPAPVRACAYAPP